MRTQLEVANYTVAIVCPLAIELTAARLMLDVEHEAPSINTVEDDNHYTCGSMCGHNVVLVNLPQWKNGLISASHLVNPLHRTFSNVQATLLVGIGGGLPLEHISPQPNKNVHLGDVVIGWDGDKTQAIVHWATTQKGRILPQPDRRILNILTKMESNQHLGRAKYLEHLNRCTDRTPFTFPGRPCDRLFETNYCHIPSEHIPCDDCDPLRTIPRPRRETDDFQLHLGTIVSVESVITDAQTRDRVRDATQALCVEMEAAGILERNNCLVIRGISDYADSHKNDLWKPYAAATAASVAREFLSIMTPTEASQRSSLPVPDPHGTSSILQNDYYLLPRDPTPLFTGRRHVLEEMRASYFASKSGPSSGQKRFVIHGEGGRGKTELCLKFAEQNREEFWGIFWIHASSRRSIERSFITIAKDCGLEQDVDVVKRWLSNRPNRWLLIFDNADDPRLDISSYFPVGDRGMILITTRNKSGRKYATVGDHELGPMAVGDATTFLLKMVDGPIDGNGGKTQQAHAQAVVARYECSPLAVEKAGAVMQKTKLSLEEYLNKYCNPRERPTSRPTNQTSRPHHQRKAHMSWDVSVEMMENASGSASQDAVDLLHILSFFHYNGISEMIFELSCRYVPTSAQDLHRMLTYRKNLLSRSRTYDWTITRYKEALSMLFDVSLISRDKDDLISIHPLIHNWARDRAREKLGPEMAERLWTAAIYILGASVSWSFTTEDYQYRRWLIPHIQSCLEATDYKRVFGVNGSNSEWLRILERLALAYTENCRREEAIYLLEEIVTVRCRLLGLSDPETLRGMNSLANAYGGIGDYSEALRMMEIVVKERTKTLRLNDPDTLSSKYNLALRHGDIGRRTEALRMLEDVLTAQELTIGANDPETLRTRNSLANYYGESGHPELARQLLETVLHVREKILGDYHPEMLSTMHNLAIWTGKTGNGAAATTTITRDTALTLMETAVQRRKVTLSKEHLDTLRSMFSLALYYRESCRIPEARQVMKSVAEGRSRILGGGHVETKRAYEMLSVLEDGSSS